VIGPAMVAGTAPDSLTFSDMACKCLIFQVFSGNSEFLWITLLISLRIPAAGLENTCFQHFAQ
jgi:hypothetical protein